MTLVRIPLVILLSLMLDLLAPVAIGSTEATDSFEERAIHRPRCNSAIRLARAVSPSRIAQPRPAPVRIRRGMLASTLSFLIGPPILKTPQPDTDSLASSEDH